MRVSNCLVRAGATGAVAVAMLVATSGPALAHGRPDQVNDPITNTGFGCVADESVGTASQGQWFTPSQPQLVAVDVVLAWLHPFPHERLVLHVDIREGGPDGAIVGSAEAVVAGPISPGTIVRPHFDLAAPLMGAAGRSLFIELRVPLASRGRPWFAWRGRDDNPYAGGDALSCFRTLPGIQPLPPPELQMDFSFISYGAAEGPASCPQIDGRVPVSEINRALANPDRVSGYNKLERPGLPPGRFNRLRTWLTLQNLALPYLQNGNRLVYRAGCP